MRMEGVDEKKKMECVGANKENGGLDCLVLFHTYYSYNTDSSSKLS